MGTPGSLAVDEEELAPLTGRVSSSPAAAALRAGTTAVGGVTPRRRKSTTSLCWVTQILEGAVVASLGIVIPDLAALHGVDAGTLSSLFLFRGLGYLVGSLVGGRLLDANRHHYNRVMAVLLCTRCACLATVLVAADNLIMVAAALAAVGFTAGAVDVTVQTLLIWLWPRQGGDKLSISVLCFGLGAAIEPLLKSIPALGLTEELVPLAMFSSVMAAGFAFSDCDAVLMDPKFVALGARKSHTAGVASSTSSSDPGTTSAAIATAARSKRQNYTQLAVLALVQFCVVGTNASMGGWIFEWARIKTGGSKGDASVVGAAFWIGGIFGNLSGALVQRKLSVRLQILVLIQLCVGICVLGTLAYATGDSPASGEERRASPGVGTLTPLALIGIAVFVFGFSVEPVIAYVFELAKIRVGNLASMDVAVITTGLALGEALVPTISGGYGIDSFLPSLVCCLVVAVVAIACSSMCR